MPLASLARHGFFLTIVILSYPFSFATAAGLAGLPSEVSRFVPDCATTCLKSFVEVYYQFPEDEGIPSFSFLCSHEGSNGFTLGEGAVQCLQAEIAVGYCPEKDAGNANTLAYSLCDGQKNAVRPTHKDIVATIPSPPAGQSIVTFPPLPSLSAGSATEPSSKPVSKPASKIPTTLVTDPSTLISTSYTTSSTTTSKAPSSTRTQPSSTTHVTDVATASGTHSKTRSTTFSTTGGIGTTSAPPDTTSSISDDENDSKPAPHLTNGQVAGISIGAIAAALLLGVAIFLAVRCRQRRSRSHRAGFKRIRETFALGSEKPGASWRGKKGAEHMSTGGSTWIGPRLSMESHYAIPPPPPPPPPPPKSYKSASLLKSGQSGLSASPAFSGTPQPSPPPQRPVSKLLPAKPVLPLRDEDDDSPPFGFDKHFEIFKGDRASDWPTAAASPSEKKWLPSLTHEPPAISRELFPSQPNLSITPLKLQIPNDVSNEKAAPFSRAFRNSTITEFEEDGGAARGSAHPLPGQVWKGPPPAGGNSRAAYYVADANGNWALADQSKTGQPAETTNPTRPTAMSRFNQLAPHGAAVTGENRENQPFRTLVGSVRRKNRSLRKKTNSLSDEGGQGPDSRRTSSVYSAQPTPLFSPRTARRSQSPGKQPTNGSNLIQSRQTSTSSDRARLATPHIADAAFKGGVFVDRYLSPVVESPRSGQTGRSPATESPRHGQKPSTTYPSWSPRPGFRENGSPTERMINTSHSDADDRHRLPSSLVQGPRQRVQLGPYPADDYQLPPLPHLSPFPSPSQGRLHHSPNPYSPAAFGPQRGLHSRPHQPPPNTYTQNSQGTYTPPPQQLRHPHSTHLGTQPIPSNRQQFGPQTQPSAPARPQPPPLQAQHSQGQGQRPPHGPWRPNLAHHSSSGSTKFSSGSGTCSSVSHNSGSSSLLEKRLGTGRADGMKLDADRGNLTQDWWTKQSSGHGGWQEWPGQRGHGSGGGPGWTPILTPSRKGDDLFLNVQ